MLYKRWQQSVQNIISTGNNFIKKLFICSLAQYFKCRSVCLCHREAQMVRNGGWCISQICFFFWHMYSRYVYKSYRIWPEDVSHPDDEIHGAFHLKSTDRTLGPNFFIAAVFTLKKVGPRTAKVATRIYHQSMKSMVQPIILYSRAVPWSPKSYI